MDIIQILQLTLYGIAIVALFCFTLLLIEFIRVAKACRRIAERMDRLSDYRTWISFFQKIPFSIFKRKKS